MLNQILRQSTTHLADGPFAVLVDYIRVLDFDVKRKYVPWISVGVGTLPVVSPLSERRNGARVPPGAVFPEKAVFLEPHSILWGNTGGASSHSAQGVQEASSTLPSPLLFLPVHLHVYLLQSLWPLIWWRWGK